MARHRNPIGDPVASATALLRRLGFATLMLVIPSLALVSRRAVVVLAPIGVSLLIIASILDGENRPIGKSNRAFAGSVPVLATIVLLVWISLSLIWTPFYEPAAARLGSILAMTALTVAGYYALPERMRASNIYLLAIGVSVAAIAGIALSVLYGQGLVEPPDGVATLERGLVAMVILVWPAVAWLSSRRRDVQAVLLALAVAAASLLGPTILPFVAFLVSGAVCVLATSAPRVATAATATAMAGLILLAPVIPFVASAFSASPVGPDAGGFLEPLLVWRDLIIGEPLRLLTGYGLEAALRGRGSGLLPANAPYSVLFEIWFDFGLVGAVAGAVALYGAVMASTRSHPPLTPGALAAFVSAFVMGAMGVATTQMWWVTTLIVVPLIFIAIARGQFRTKRPKALLRMIGER